MGKRGPKFKMTDAHWVEFEKLCFIHCTLMECAAFFSVSEDTIERSVERHYGQKFAEVMEQKRGIGKMSLRRAMWNKACKAEDNTMMIWLSKNHLGMSDKTESTVKAAAPGKATIVFETAPANPELSYDQKPGISESDGD